MNNFSRRQILLAAGSTLVASPFIMRRPAMAAEISYKYANNLPVSHPMNIRAKEAADKAEIPEEPEAVDPSEELKKMIDAALNEPQP